MIGDELRFNENQALRIIKSIAVCRMSIFVIGRSYENRETELSWATGKWYNATSGVVPGAACGQSGGTRYQNRSAGYNYNFVN